MIYFIFKIILKALLLIKNNTSKLSTKIFSIFAPPQKDRTDYNLGNQIKKSV